MLLQFTTFTTLNAISNNYRYLFDSIKKGEKEKLEKIIIKF